MLSNDYEVLAQSQRDSAATMSVLARELHLYLSGKNGQTVSAA